MSFHRMKNVYTCPAGHKTVTIDLDEGTTPFKLGCSHPGCKELGTSAMYRVDQSLEPTHGFYFPTMMEVNTLSRAEREHVMRGGLLFRSLDGDERCRYAAAQFD